MRTLLLVLAVFAMAPVAQAADQTLAPTGALRAVYLAANPAQAARDPQTGEVKGVAVDLANALAKRAGAPLQLEGLGGVQAVIDAVRDGRADIGFLANDPSRRGPIEFSQTYLRNPQSILVGPGAAIRDFADLEKPGIRIAGLRNDSVMLFIARTYPGVTLVQLEAAQTDPALVLESLRARQFDGFAANRLRLTAMAKGAPDLRILPGSLFGVPQAIIVPVDQPERLRAVNAFLKDAREDGSLQAAIDRAANGTEIEPPSGD